ncbi:MAG: hypothetical protein E7E83_13995, partial [Enterobacter ludwigii]|nr:hypothetical protein [Enterobacter ludwigii]
MKFYKKSLPRQKSGEVILASTRSGILHRDFNRASNVQAVANRASQYAKGRKYVSSFTAGVVPDK